MTRKLDDLMAELSPGERKEVARRTRLHLKAMEDAERLDQVRKAANKTQQEVAELMGIGQNAVSQLEKRGDLQLSTLHRYVQSMGLRLELAVVGASGQRAVLKNYKPWEASPPKRAKTGRAKASAEGAVAGQRATSEAAGSRTRSASRREGAAASGVLAKGSTGSAAKKAGKGR